MKPNETKLIDGVHRGLLDVLAAEHPDLGQESTDTLALAARIVRATMLEGAGEALVGQYDAEFTHRAKLLCALEIVDTKGKSQRVARAVCAYQRALAAALAAVEGAE